MAETRNKKIHFINMGTEKTPKWVQINRGFTAFQETLNSENESTQYIGEQNSTEAVKKYAPSIAYTYKVEDGEEVVEKFYDIAYKQLLNQKVEIMTVDTWRLTKDDFAKATKGFYNVIPDSSGDSDPGEYLEGSGTLNQDGSLQYGYYIPASSEEDTGSFVEAEDSDMDE